MAFLSHREDSVPSNEEFQGGSPADFHFSSPKK
jgi:hypothetical protein